MYLYTESCQNNLLKFKLSIRIRKKGDLSDSKSDMYIILGWFYPMERSEYFRNCWSIGFFHTQPSLEFTKNDPKGQRRMGRRFQNNSQIFITTKIWRISSLNAQTLGLEADGIQQQGTPSGTTPFSKEHETEATIPTETPKLDNRRLKKTFPDLTACQFQLWHSDGRIRVWNKNISVDPSCLMWMVQVVV